MEDSLPINSVKFIIYETMLYMEVLIHETLIKGRFVKILFLRELLPIKKTVWTSQPDGRLPKLN